VELPEHVLVSEAALRAIGQTHGVHGGGPFERLPDTGIFNAHFLLGADLVLRVPRAHPAQEAALRREIIAVPAARGAGVRAPNLVVFDDSRAVLDSPYAIYQRVPGRTLESLEAEPLAVAEPWRELGRDLARTHAIRTEEIADALSAPADTMPDPRTLVEARAAAGYFATSEARWLLGWLERLAPAALAATPNHLVHGDVQASNVMVDGNPPRYVALLDWGGAAWGDPAHDFAGVPLGAVPLMLEGYRQIAPLDDDDRAEMRIVWRHVQLALWLVARRPMPGYSWAERPLGMLLETLRFFAAEPPEPWRGLGPRR
jgi:aminoglycoside phosphotransferase (APT) family kinase protein